MALDWFAFNADAYTGDTAHLTTEEHGAYLLLMLAYYRSEKPLPATDKALASITKLSMDRWLDCKPTLAPFFVEENGVWRHLRIEAEIADGYAKQKKSAEQARAASEARWRKSRSNARALLGECSSDAPLPLPNNSPSVVREGEKEESGENTVANDEIVGGDQQVDGDARAVDIDDYRPSPTMIDRNYQPPTRIKDKALEFMDASTFHLEIQKFIFYNQSKGSMSVDWDASFELWIARFRDVGKQRGKPRVELNLPPEEETKINWDWHLSRWVKDESSWRRRTAGPEPGQVGCKVPTEMFEKYGIDPQTGRKMIKETT